MYKVLLDLILNRIKPYIKDIIGDYQCGFTTNKNNFLIVIITNINNFQY